MNDDLHEQCAGGPPPALQSMVPLAPLTSLELGGPAAQFLRVDRIGELREALAWAAAQRIPLTVLGGGSNVVIADQGVDGMVVHMGLRGVGVERDESTALLTAAAGEIWDEVVALAVAEGLSGIECLSGIPGTVGAVPIQNVGAYGQDVAQVIEYVRVMERSSGREKVVPRAECGFGYRRSHFRSAPSRWAIVEVGFRLHRAGVPQLAYPELRRFLGEGSTTPTLAEIRAAVLELRTRKSMVIRDDDANRRSVGSFFVNPVVDGHGAERLARRAVAVGAVREAQEVPVFPVDGGLVKLSAAWLVERSGFPKGTRRGPVGVSSRHALALVHHGGGSTHELLDLASDIVDAVDDRFGILLHPEPSFLGFGGDGPLRTR